MLNAREHRTVYTERTDHRSHTDAAWPPWGKESGSPSSREAPEVLKGMVIVPGASSTTGLAANVSEGPATNRTARSND
jgi:hypothetical protein